MAQKKDSQRILIIDDDHNIWKAYQMILNPGRAMPKGSSVKQLADLLKPANAPKSPDDNFQLAYADQGQTGFEMVQASLDQNQPFALAFIDIRMPPGWNGVKTSAKIRQIDPNIEIVIITAFSDHSLEEIVRTVGAPDKLLFFRKPFDPDALKQLAVSLISKRRLARREEEQRQALATSKNRFQALVETTSDLVWEVDIEGRFTYCSPVCTDLYGYKPEELLGKLLFEIPRPADPNDTRTRDIFEECVRYASKCRATERVILKKDDETIVVESSGTPVFNNNHEVVGFRGIDRDITLRKKNEEERLRLEEQYRQAQKLEALGTLAGGISHDLNNILTPIIGYCQICLMNLNPGDPMEQNLKTIEKCTLKAADLIRQILAFSRKETINTRPLSINSLINDFTKMLRRLIREDIELVMELADTLWTIEADHGQMDQILVNLVVNARDAMANGGLLIIRTENQTILPDEELFDVNQQLISGDFIVLTTTDTGHGISPQTMELIFDPFFTTKEVGKGTGLGLATVHGIVLKHNGHIRVESEPNKGTSFHIFLPRSDKETENINPSLVKTYIKQGNETILIVEDAEEVLALLAKIMTENGYKVLKAGDGIEALEIFKEKGDTIDLLVTDLIMPGMGGRELVKNIRDTAPQMPVLYISGHSFELDLEHIASKACADFIQKPFSLPAFTTKIRKMLDNC